MSRNQFDAERLAFRRTGKACLMNVALAYLPWIAAGLIWLGFVAAYEAAWSH